MATFKPVGQAPVRESINSRQSDWVLSRDWQVFFETIRQNVAAIKDFKLTIDPSTVSANSTEEQSFSTNEIESNDLILSVNKPSHTSGVGIAGFRAGDNKIFITFVNPTGSGADPGSEDYLVAVLKR